MAQFKAFAPNVQINGETVLAIVEGVTSLKDIAKNILSKNGIDNPEAGKWYPQQNWLNAFEEISKKMGAGTLKSIGNKIPDNANFPPEINSFDIALSSIDVAYHMNHKGGEIGSYKYLGRTEGKKEAKILCENPYPCDFDMGIIESMAKRFKPEGVNSISIKHGAGDCRKNGANSCEYVLFWF